VCLNPSENSIKISLNHPLKYPKSEIIKILLTTKDNKKEE
jgi:hypothetical protein